MRTDPPPDHVPVTPQRNCPMCSRWAWAHKKTHVLHDGVVQDIFECRVCGYQIVERHSDKPDPFLDKYPNKYGDDF